MQLKPQDIQLLVLILACSLSTQTGHLPRATASTRSFDPSYMALPCVSWARCCQAKADLRLDIPSSALQRNSKGQAAILPGRPSCKPPLIVQRMHHPDPEERMPPTETGLELTKEEKESIEAWIREGATYEKHWAFEVPKEIQPPSVVHQSWVRLHRSVRSQSMDATGAHPTEGSTQSGLVPTSVLTLTGLHQILIP